MLKQTLREQLNDSMRQKNAVKTSTLRMLLSAIQYAEMGHGKAGYEATDEEILEVARKEAKKRREAIELYKQGKREDLANKESEELKIIQSYLPAQMNEDEIKSIVQQAIKEVTASSVADIGKVMAVVMPKLKGKADGSVVSKITRELLSTT